MTALALLTALRQRGVHLEPDGAGLRSRAPAGSLTDANRAALHEHRDALVELLTTAATLEADGTAAGLRAAWAALTAADRERLQAEADDGDRLAVLILASLGAPPAPAAVEVVADSGEGLTPARDVFPIIPKATATKTTETTTQAAQGDLAGTPAATLRFEGWGK